jgi:hypothetical protein
MSLLQQLTIIIKIDLNLINALKLRKVFDYAPDELDKKCKSSVE